MPTAPSVPSVPFVTAWSEETEDTTPVVMNPRGGIAHPNENPFDRDEWGVLWARRALRRGHGQPRLGQVHPQRQRMAMGSVCCQVCRQQADSTPEGILWLLDRGTGPRRLQAVEKTTQPPVCKPCAVVAVVKCPALRRGHFLVRVRDFSIDGVWGQVYRPSFPVPRPKGPQEFVPYCDPHTGRVNPDRAFVLAEQLYATLRNPTLLTHA